jgi:hypothetical protein
MNFIFMLIRAFVFYGDVFARPNGKAGRTSHTSWFRFHSICCHADFQNQSTNKPINCIAIEAAKISSHHHTKRNPPKYLEGLCISWE